MSFPYDGKLVSTPWKTADTRLDPDSSDKGDTATHARAARKERMPAERHPYPFKKEPDRVDAPPKSAPTGFSRGQTI